MKKINDYISLACWWHCCLILECTDGAAQHNDTHSHVRAHTPNGQSFTRVVSAQATAAATGMKAVRAQSHAEFI